MFLKHAGDGRMVEVLGLNDLFNPMHAQLVGRYHVGEELQEPEKFTKSDLVFLSGEALPKCWLDRHYRDHDLQRTG
ncbi:MAG: acetyltransferase [gamma proteobacterium symbiont of Phacoides pectinatus]